MMELIRQFDSVGWFLIDVALKSTVLLLLVYALDRLLLKRRPITADTMWSATVLMLALLPLCCLALPRFALPMPRAVIRQIETPTHSLTGGHLVEHVADPVTQSYHREVITPKPTAASKGQIAIVETPFEVQPEASSIPTSTNILLTIAVIYCLGVAFSGFRLGTTFFLLSILRRDTTDVSSDSWTAVLGEYKQRLGLRCKVLLCQSPNVSAPLTIGWRCPTVILPSLTLGEASGDAIKVVLLHELTHVVRGDYLANVVTKVVQCIYWYNPLIWLASRRLGQIRETVCDGYCISSLGDRDGYVRVLLKYAQRITDCRQAALGLSMVRVSRLEKRLEHLIPINRFSAGKTVRLASLLAALVVTITLGLTEVAEPTTNDVSTPENDNTSQMPTEKPTLSQTGAKALDEIVEGLKKSERSISSLVVTHSYESQHNLTEPGKPLPAGMMIEDNAVSMRRKGKVSWEVERDGRGRMEAKYLRTNSRFDGSQVKKQEVYISTFDGKKGVVQTTTSSEKGVVLTSNQRPVNRFTLICRSPFDFATHQNGKPISDLVAQKGGKVIGNEKWEERPVVVVEVSPVTVRDDYKFRQRFWIDSQRNHLVVRRQSYVQRGKGKPWGLHLQIDLLKNKEVLPGIWLPMTVEYWNYHVTPAGQGHLVSRHHIEVSKWSVNKVLSPSRFKIEPGAIDKIGSLTIATGDPDKQTALDDQSDGIAQPENAPDGFRYMTIRTIDGQGKPVQNTGIYVNIWPDEPYKTSKREYTTDANGEAAVLVPDPPRLFRMWTQKQGYVPLFAQWWPKHQPDGHIIPREFTFSLPSGTEIGGVIKNEDGDPIKGAIVEVMLANRVDEMQRRAVPSIWLAEVPGPGKNPCVTNAKGVWSLDNVPEGDDVHVRVKLTHPQYISDTRWGTLQEEQAISMKSFRDQSATIVMHRGIVLTGTVTDTAGQPVSDAVVVWGDDPYGQEGSQEVRTNAKGIYQTAPLEPGTTTVTVVAAGWRPESRTVDINAENRSADFQLKKGKILRIRFVDSSGKAVPDVGVCIRGWRGGKALYNHRHPNVLNTGIPVRADAEGIFEWRWAPADRVEYSFYAKDLQTVDRPLNADGTERTVKFSK